jgi:hypothetical protein
MSADPNPYASPTSDGNRIDTPTRLASTWQLRFVHWGLALIYGSLLLMLLGVVLLFIGRSIYSATILPISQWLFVAFAGLWVLGHLLCLPAPTACGARWWNVACIGVQWGTGPMLLLFSDPQARGVFRGMMVTLMLATFLLFMRQLALALNHPRLASQASATLLAGIALGVVAASYFIIRAAGIRLLSGGGAIAILIATLVYAGAIAKLVRGLRMATWQRYRAQKRNSTAVSLSSPVSE